MAAPGCPMWERCYALHLTFISTNTATQPWINSLRYEGIATGEKVDGCYHIAKKEKTSNHRLIVDETSAFYVTDTILLKGTVHAGMDDMLMYIKTKYLTNVTNKH